MLAQSITNNVSTKHLVWFKLLPTSRSFGRKLQNDLKVKLVSCNHRKSTHTNPVKECR